MPGAGNPQALNRYSYVLGNPLKYTDPSGHYCVGIKDDIAECAFIEHQIVGSYGIDTNNAWDVEAINDFWKRLQEVSGAVGGDRIVKSIWGGTSVFLYKDGAEIAKYNACDDPSIARPCSKGSRINMPRDRLRSGDIAHELAHVWDFRTPTPIGLARIIDTNDTGQGGLWREMANETGGRYCYGFSFCANGGSMSESWWALGTNDPGTPSYARANPWEDWAMSFELYVTRADDYRKSYYNDSQWAQRQSFIGQQIGLAWYRSGW